MDSQKQVQRECATPSLRHLKELVFPKASGVYLMKNEKDVVLYVGKAKNLQSRIRSYLSPSSEGRMMVPLLMAQVVTIDTLVVSSEKEALLLENNLIKKYKPKYNALLKDDKSFFSLMINNKDPWPMIRLVRYKGRPPKGKLYFGPFTHASAAKEMLQLMRQLFPLRTCSDRELAARKRPCILYDMKRCIAPCVHKCTKEEYDALSEQAVQFLRGASSSVVAMLKKQRAAYTEALTFEKAEAIHKSILAIEKTLEKQQVEQLTFGDYDVFGLHRSAASILLMQLKIREGKLIGAKEHAFTDTIQSDEELLSSFLLQSYHEREEEKCTLLIPSPLHSQTTISQLLGKEIICPKKGTRHKLIKMAEMNAQVAAHRIAKEQDATHDILMELEEKLALNNYPMRIECYDNSNLSQTNSVSVKVAFKQGKAEKALYRKYTLEATDDYSALEEVLTRRFSRTQKEEELPDLLLIDGGRGQLHVASKVMAALNIARVDVVALCKEEGRHDKGLAAEKLFIAGQKGAVLLPPRSKVLLFLQKVRDETHRFALSFQKEKRKKELLQSSLDGLPGIGPIKKRRLLSHFGSVAHLAKMDKKAWLEVEGITEKDCLILEQEFRKEKES